MHGPPAYAVDMIFAVNLVFDFFFFWLAASLVSARPRLWKVGLVSLLGAVLAILPLLVPWTRWLASGPALLVMSILLVVLLVWPGSLADMAATYAGFWLVLVVAGGAIEALVVPFNSRVRADSVYSIGVGVAATFIGLRWIWREYSDRRIRRSLLYRLRIRLGTQRTVLTGLLDSGNRLSSLGSFRPVAVVEAEAVRYCLPSWALEVLTRGWDGLDQIPALWQSRCQIVPYTSLGNGGSTLFVLTPDELEVWERQRACWVQVRGAVGLTPQLLDSQGRYQALLPLQMVQEVEETSPRPEEGEAG